MPSPATSGQHMVAVVIAVADAKPLDFLAAALNGARDFAQWAQAQGYETVVITDEDPKKPVTTERLTKEMDAVLQTASSRPINRLVLYFAGHGLVQGAEETLWLVSNWKTARRCVHLPLLKRLLFTWHINQIAIFSDACRLLPNSEPTDTLTKDGLIGDGSKFRAEDEVSPRVDTFAASQNYARAFAVPGKKPNQDRCIFTGVLMPGLWGATPEAFSPTQSDRVVSQSLGNYLENEIPRVAKKYSLKLAPTIAPMFRPGEDVYYLTGAGMVKPTFPDWPPPEDVLPPEDLTVELNLDTSGRGAGGTGVVGRGTLEVDFDAGGGSAGIGDDFSAKQVRPRRGQSVSSLRETALDDFEGTCGFVVAGAEVKQVWAPVAVYAESANTPHSWKLHSGGGETLRAPAPVLLELEGGQFAALTALPGFIGTVLCEKRGVSTLIYHDRYAQPLTKSPPAAAALRRMARGSLRGADAIDLAVKLREFKHVDPVLGVISAYLYDAIGDVDSIRRMAYFYVSHSQPIPYDIALLAQLHGDLKDGVYVVNVPGVSERPPRTTAEKTHSWSYQETSLARGIVGGLWPWLRQGWPLLNDPSDQGSRLINPGLRDMADELRPGRFATVDAAGAMKLADMFQLVERTPPPGPTMPMSPQGAPLVPTQVPARTMTKTARARA